MKPERRCTYRERPAELSYLQFEPEGGGIVLNASEQGLAFHVAAALRQPGPVQLCVSPNPMHQIKLTAEIVWTDETKKSGGLRFTELTADARTQIRQWLTQTRESVSPDGKFVIPSCVAKDETDSSLRAQSGTLDLQPLTPTLDNAIPSRADAASISGARSCGIDMPATGLRPVPFSQEEQIFIFVPRLRRVAAIGFLVAVCALMPILHFQNLRREIGNSLIRVGEKLNGSADSQPRASSSTPVQISNPSSGTSPFAPDPVPQTPAKETANLTTLGALNSMDSHTEDRQNFRQHLRDAYSRRGDSALAGHLWSAVEAGDSSAEVALAQLYLTGDGGVPRNCEQARVLLEAASKSGNIKAMEQSRKLSNSPCR
jgi:PilZ domain